METLAGTVSARHGRRGLRCRRQLHAMRVFCREVAVQFALAEVVAVSQLMQVAQHLQIRTEQSLLAVLSFCQVTSTESFSVSNASRSSRCRAACVPRVGRSRLARTASLNQRPPSADAGQMVGIAAEQQHRIENAPARRGEMGEAHRTVDAAVVVGLRIELLCQPAPPFGETVAAHRLPPIPAARSPAPAATGARIVQLQAGIDAQHVAGFRAVRASQPASVFCLFCSSSAAAWRRRASGCCSTASSCGKRDEFLQPRHHALFAQQLFQLVHRRLAFASGHDRRR